MSVEHTVAEALKASGDVGAAVTWNQVLEELAGDLRVAVTAGLGENGPRWRRALPDVPGVEWVWIEPASEGSNLGAQYRLLGSHSLVFLTPITSPLGQLDRETLGVLEQGGPGQRGVVLADEALLERLSDDPAGERALVVARLEELLPDGWQALDQVRLVEWLEHLRTDAHLRAQRRLEVARFLLTDRLERDRVGLERESDLLASIEARLAGADEALEGLRQQARRWAAHTLAILQRQTSQLALDLAAYLREVEAGLPEQLASVEDVHVLRKSLPHWLSHIVESWLDDRIATWRQQVLAELEELELDDPLHAQLVVPALQPGHVRGETHWGNRIAATAAFGGAAALLALGLWIPSLLAVAGGIAWSTAQRGQSEAEDRHTLLVSARDALRQMGDDAERLLGEQLDQLQQELAAMSAEVPAAEEHRATRELLEEQASRIREEVHRRTERVTGLQSALQALEEVT